MGNEFVKLRHFTATIEIGTTDRSELCPWCRGGTSGEKSFAITRTTEAEAKYCCHRASCGRSGRIAVWGFRLRQLSDSGAVQGKSFTPKLYTRDTLELGEEWFTELLDLYGLQRSEALGAGWRSEAGSGCLVCPVLSPLGVVRGYEVRRSKVQVPYFKTPKTISYRFLDEPWLGWYRKVTGVATVLVEDCISALKVSRHFQVVCLHGSHLSTEMLLEIIGVVGNQEVIVALDRDATNKAIKVIVNNRFLAPNFRCVILSKDLKYVSDEEIVETMRA